MAFSWINHTSANVTLISNKSGTCYYKWVSRNSDGTSATPKDLTSTGKQITFTADKKFNIGLEDLDSDNPIDLYIQIKDKNGVLTNPLKIAFKEDSRPKVADPTPTDTPDAYIPNVKESVVQGLDEAIQFYPNQFYEFTVIGAGTTNQDPNEGDVKWVPVYWSTAANPTQSQMHTAWKIGSAKGINKAATYNLYVFFAKYTYTGGQWQETDRIESVRYQFRSAALTTVKLTTPGLSGTSNSPAGIVFKWKKAANASGYKIYRRTGNSSKWVNIATVSGSNTLVYTDGSVKSGTMYTYTVRAYKGSALSAYNKNGSRIVRLTAPVQYKPSSKASGKLTVRWKKAAGASGYQIQYAASRSMRGARTVSTSALTRTLSGLEKGKHLLCSYPCIQKK